MHTRPDVIIFDYGKVLVGPIDPEAFARNQETLAQDYGFATGQDLWHHIYISDAWEQAKRGHITYDALWADRLEPLGIRDDAGRTAFKHRLFEYWDIFPSMRGVLRGLKDRGYRLAVLSNSARQGFREYLEVRRGFADLFDCAISSAEVGYAKPEPEIYQIALDCLGVEALHTLFVDDLPRNTTAAAKLGIPTIVFSGPDALVVELKKRTIL